MPKEPKEESWIINGLRRRNIILCHSERSEESFFKILRFAQDDTNKDLDKAVKYRRISVRRKASNPTNLDLNRASRDGRPRPSEIASLEKEVADRKV